MAHIKFSEHKGRRVPEEIITFVNELEKIAGIDMIGYGNFIRRGNQEKEPMDLRNYSEQSQILKVRVTRPEYLQIVLVKTHPTNLRVVTDFIKDYKF